MPLSRRSEGGIGEFAIIPLVDVVMTILIFLFTTRGPEPSQYIDVAPPGPDHERPIGEGAPGPAGERFAITIDQWGNYQVGGAGCSLEGVQDYLAAKAGAGVEPTVVVNADRRANVQSLVSLETLCRRLHLRRLQLVLKKGGNS